MTRAEQSSVTKPMFRQSPLWFAIAIAMTGNVWAANGESDNKKVVNNTAPISAETAKELLRYLINSKSLAANDAQQLVEQMQSEQAKKTSEELLKSLINSKALSLTDAQKLVDSFTIRFCSSNVVISNSNALISFFKILNAFISPSSWSSFNSISIFFKLFKMLVFHTCIFF